MAIQMTRQTTRKITRRDFAALAGGFLGPAPPRDPRSPGAATSLPLQVSFAGIRIIIPSTSVFGPRTDGADDRLAAFVDVDVLDADVLFSATAQASVGLHLRAIGPQQLGCCRCQVGQPLRTTPGASDPRQVARRAQWRKQQCFRSEHNMPV